MTVKRGDPGYEEIGVAKQSESCKTCRFWSQFYGGLCRRYPPTVVWEQRDDFGADGGVFRNVYPSVRHTDWCGEHKPKEESGG